MIQDVSPGKGSRSGTASPPAPGSRRGSDADQQVYGGMQRLEDVSNFSGGTEKTPTPPPETPDDEDDNERDMDEHELAEKDMDEEMEHEYDSDSGDPDSDAPFDEEEVESQYELQEEKEVENGTKYVIYVFAVLVGVWYVLIVVLLIGNSEAYRGPTVNEDRARYAAITAHRVGAEVASILSSAVMVRDAIEYAVNRKLYFEPLDYTAARQMLEPTFAAATALRSVDLAFTNRTTSVSLRRVLDGTGVDPGPLQGMSPVKVLLQTDAEDCLEKLGRLGCLRSEPAHEQEWFEQGSQLYGGTENPSAAGNTADKMRWHKDPLFVPRAPDKNTAAKKAAALAEAEALKEEGSKMWWIKGDPFAVPIGYMMDRQEVAWDTTYSLIFRSTFPGTRGYMSVVGRISVDLSGMRAMDRLVDAEWLGAAGLILVCDGSGHVIAAAGPGLQAEFNMADGVLRPRLASEVPAPWAFKIPELDNASGNDGEMFFKGAGNGGAGSRSLDAEGFYVAVEPLRGRALTDFSVIVAAQRGAFIDGFLDGMAGTSYTLLALPIPGAVFVFTVVQAFEFIKNRKKLSKVAPNEQGKPMSPNMQRRGSNGDAKIAQKPR